MPQQLDERDTKKSDFEDKFSQGRISAPRIEVIRFVSIQNKMIYIYIYIERERERERVTTIMQVDPNRLTHTPSMIKLKMITL